MSKTIKLSQGREAIVDDDDYERLSQYKWHYNEKKPGHGYAQRTSSAKERRDNGCRNTIYMHREVLKTDQEIDHINGNKTDNRKDNLRPSDRLQQNRNRSSRRGSTSKYVGVHFSSANRVWIASIKVNKDRVHIGCYPTEEEANVARVNYITEKDLEGFRR